MEHMLYILACVIFYLALVRTSVNRYLALVPFLLLLFSPYHHGSVERGWFYAGLVLLVIAGLYYMISLRLTTGRIRRSHSLLLGVVLACLYLSREETIWLYPLLITAFVFLFYQADKRKMVSDLVRVMPVILIAAALPILAVMSANYYKYGMFGVTDTSIEEFSSALKKIKSVKIGKEVPFVDVTQDALDKMFAASVTFSSLAPSLKGHIGKQWGGLMCRRHQEACGEIGGGYFFWALRDTLAAGDHFQSFNQMRDLYAGISDELGEACQSKQLDCSRFVWPARYPVRLHRVNDYLAKLPGFVSYMVSGLNGRVPGYGPPMGPEESLKVFRQLSNTTFLSQSAGESFTVSGWLISDQIEKYIAIVPTEVGGYTSHFSLKRSPDLSSHFPDNAHADLSRFSTEGLCPKGECELLVMSGAKQMRLDQSRIRPGKGEKIDGLHLHIDSVVSNSAETTISGFTYWKIEAFKSIGQVYNQTLKYLSLFALMVFIYACYAFLFRGYRSLLIGGVLIALLGIFGRLGVLALFDDFTQSPVIGQIRHFLPVMPFLLIFIGLNFLILFELLYSVYRGEKRPVYSSGTN
ncbi:MAG: hypothetical protein AAES65_12345 [Candidatus Thiodiazotropha sp. (ex. Lucinoma kazani)]